MASARLQALERRIGELRRLLLPHRFDPTGTYSQSARVRVKTLAFRVLAHAELESYFEDRVVEIAKAALREWKAHRFVSAVTLHLLGFSGQEVKLPPDTLEAPTENKKKNWDDEIEIAKRFEWSVSEFVRRTTMQNHGIKEQNLMLMLLPIGFARGRLDQLLVAALNQFGEERGLVAHSSGASYVTQSVDPSTEFRRVADLLGELVQIDTDLDGLLAAAAKPTA